MPSPEFLAAFTERAKRHSDDDALVFHQQRITYGQLADLVTSARARINALGVPDGAGVCVSARKSPEAVALIIACLAGNRRVLLPAADLGGDVLTTLCTVASCSHVLTVASGTVAVTQVVTGVDGPVGAAGLLLTTSGSTGVPKIVPIRPGGADSFMDWAIGQFGLGRGTTVLSYAPLNFDLSLLDVWASLRTGGRVVLADQDRATDAGYLRGLFEHGIEVVQSVPMLYRLLSDGTDAVFDGVRHVVFTGDVTAPSLVRRLGAMFPRGRFYNLYGCTETNDSFLHEIDLARLRDTDRIPIGRPLPGVDALILGTDGAVVDGAGAGELCVSTPFQADGYLESWRDEGVFVPHPDPAAAGPCTYYRSGDIVTRRADGTVLLEGRNDFHVKVRGVRTNIAEVEQVILEHPEVREAVVVALPDELAGARLHALVRREPGGALNTLVLRTHCAGKLPRTAIPSTLSIVEQPLPRTATGKPDRNLIKQSSWKGKG